MWKYCMEYVNKISCWAFVSNIRFICFQYFWKQSLFCVADYALRFCESNVCILLHEEWNECRDIIIWINLFAEKRRLTLCVGCGSQIYDQYILRVAPDLEWHAACLKCVECHQFLDESCTCFVRDGKTFCKRDYVRWVKPNC